MSLHGSRVSSMAQSELPRLEDDLHGLRVSLHGSRVSSMAPVWASMDPRLQDEPPQLQGWASLVTKANDAQATQACLPSLSLPSSRLPCQRRHDHKRHAMTTVYQVYGNRFPFCFLKCNCVNWNLLRNLKCHYSSKLLYFIYIKTLLVELRQFTML